MAFAGAGWPQEVQHLRTLDELQLGQGQDAIAVERGLEREVEAGQRLDGRQPRHHQRRLDAARFAQRQFLGQEQVDGFERAHLATLDPAQDDVDDLQRHRHLQADEAPLDAVHDAGRNLDGAHDAPPRPARPRPIAS